MGNYHAGFVEGVTVLLAIGITYSTLFGVIPVMEFSEQVYIFRPFCFCVNNAQNNPPGPCIFVLQDKNYQAVLMTQEAASLPFGTYL
jgi:hypothetical protein